MPQSGKKKDAIWVRKVEGDKALVRLRRNFEEKTQEDEEGNEETYWQFDEADVELKNRGSLRKYIEENFDTVWLMNIEEMAKHVKG